MRVLVFSDVHGNLLALEAVLADAGKVDAYWCLGDLVGYGPEPEACVERVRALPHLVCLQGNHDAAVAGILDVTFFNAEARKSVFWTREHLSPASLDFLRHQPPLRVLEPWDVTLAHGSPRHPLEEYLLSVAAARAALRRLTTSVAFVGHTHLPGAFLQVGKRVQLLEGAPYQRVVVEASQRGIFNPGSVGQPRDGNPWAAYAIWDTEERAWEWRRVAYDVAAVQERILALGLPPFHAYRLGMGR